MFYTFSISQEYFIKKNNRVGGMTWQETQLSVVLPVSLVTMSFLRCPVAHGKCFQLIAS